jgi:hypothetical protein
MSTERVLAIAVFVTSVLLLLRLGPPAVQSWRIYAGTGPRRQQDATGRAPIPPAEVADRLALLSSVGYHRLGETRLDLPVGERFGWILAADDAESYAIVVAAPRAVGLTGTYSAWLDGTWLCTIHPRGQAVDRPGLQVRIVPSTLEEMVRLHRAGLERLGQVHGAPRPIATMADMLALDADYRTRFGGTRLRPTVARIVLPTIVLVALAVLSLALVLVSGR